MSLQDDALRLAELDRSVVRAFIENNTEEMANALVAYSELRNSVKVSLLSQSVATVEDTEADGVLRKISDGDGLPSNKLLERLAARGGEELAEHDFDEEEIEALGSDLFSSWVSHHEYVAAFSELRPLIFRCAVPKNV